MSLSAGMSILNIWKNETCSKPPTRKVLGEPRHENMRFKLIYLMMNSGIWGILNWVSQLIHRFIIQINQSILFYSILRFHTPFSNRQKHVKIEGFKPIEEPKTTKTCSSQLFVDAMDFHFFTRQNNKNNEWEHM